MPCVSSRAASSGCSAALSKLLLVPCSEGSLGSFKARRLIQSHLEDFAFELLEICRTTYLASSCNFALIFLHWEIVFRKKKRERGRKYAEVFLRSFFLSFGLCIFEEFVSVVINSVVLPHMATQNINSRVFCKCRPLAVPAALP